MARDLTPDEVKILLMNEDWKRYVSWDFYATDEKGSAQVGHNLKVVI